MSWRSGKGSARFLIGTLTRESAIGDDITFTYNLNELAKAQKEGFFNYPDFENLETVYQTNLKTVFSLRLMPKSRADRENYLAFWMANINGLDWFDELGFTQGILATDTFEFLAEFPKKYNGTGVAFISNIASLSHLDLSTDCINEGDKLRFVLDPTNKFDDKAVKLYENDLFIGYVKRGHNQFFYKVKPEEVEIKVTKIEKNGKMKQIYFSVRIL